MVFLYIYTALVIFYLWYIASVQLYYAWDTLDIQVKIAAGPMLFLFLIFDALLNTALTFVFLDLPFERLVTERLTRYRNGVDGWRKRVATGICEKFLNPFDPTGRHC